jgi:hypothetical protein
MEMDLNPTWPSSLVINAHTGDKQAVAGNLDTDARRWVLRVEPTRVKTFLKPPVPADPNDWRDPRVGWGLILPKKPGLSDSELAGAADAPKPIQKLLAARSDALRTPGGPAPVFRYVPNSKNRSLLLRNYRDGKDLDINGSPPGVAPGCLPRYLLIYGTPEEIPWDFQYLLNASSAVGRLSLKDQALENYVGALLSDWANAGARHERALVWAVDHGPADITHLMRNAIAQRLYNDLKDDADLGPNSAFADGTSDPAAATGAKLVSELAARQPGLIVTTSHGQTGPLDDLVAMGAQLGFPVDQQYQTVTPAALLAQWRPDGAIWYAHACCSAGSDARTLFDGLVAAGSPVDAVLKGVEALGARVAPLPEALLGADKPLRAFIGHVEPTFDWTLRQPATGQHLTDTIERALYHNLYQPMTLGWALRDCYDRIGSLFAAYDNNLRAFNRGENTRSAMLYCLLAARDVQSRVILGDPTTILPAL